MNIYGVPLSIKRALSAAIILMPLMIPALSCATDTAPAGKSIPQLRCEQPSREGSTITSGEFPSPQEASRAAAAWEKGLHSAGAKDITVSMKEGDTSFSITYSADLPLNKLDKLYFRPYDMDIRSAKQHLPGLLTLMNDSGLHPVILLWSDYPHGFKTLSVYYFCEPGKIINSMHFDSRNIAVAEKIKTGLDRLNIKHVSISGCDEYDGYMLFITENRELARLRISKAVKLGHDYFKKGVKKAISGLQGELLCEHERSSSKFYETLIYYLSAPETPIQQQSTEPDQ